MLNTNFLFLLMNSTSTHNMWLTTRMKLYTFFIEWAAQQQQQQWGSRKLWLLWGLEKNIIYFSEDFITRFFLLVLLKFFCHFKAPEIFHSSHWWRSDLRESEFMGWNFPYFNDSFSISTGIWPASSIRSPKLLAISQCPACLSTLPTRTHQQHSKVLIDFRRVQYTFNFQV